MSHWTEKKKPDGRQAFFVASATVPEARNSISPAQRVGFIVR